MEVISYVLNDIQEMQKTIKENNMLILNKINGIKVEFDNMLEVLNTPNFNKLNPQLSSIINNDKNILEKNNLYFQKTLNTIVESYNEFIEDTKKSVDGW